jgi:hypothetical protein
MKTQTLKAVLAAVIFFSVALAEEPKSPPDPDISDTRTASCLVKVTADPAIFPLSLETMDNLLHSSGVLGKAARDVLDLPLDESHELLSVTQLTSRSARRGRTRSGIRSRTARTPPKKPEQLDEEYLRYEDERALREIEMLATGGKYRPKTYAPKQPPAPAAAVEDQSILFRLEVDLEPLDDQIKPAARQFTNALIQNLRHALSHGWQTARNHILDEIRFAEDQREQVHNELSAQVERARPEITVNGPTATEPADKVVFEQFEQIIDLSGFNPEMSFADALEILKTSVKPPLNIVVLWRDLIENAEVDQTTPINMDPVSSVPLGTALHLLLKSLYAGIAELGYVVEGGVITITTVDSLPSNLQTWVFDVPLTVGADSLLHLLPNTVEPDSWYTNGGEGTITIYHRRKAVIRQTRQIHEKILKFLGRLNIDAPQQNATPTDVPPEMLHDRKLELLRRRQSLEMDIARNEAYRDAIENQIAAINERVTERVESDSTAFELQRLIDLNVNELERAKKALDEGKSVTGIDQVTEKIARAKIDLARRHEELSSAVGGDELRRLTKRLTELMIELPVKKAELEVATRQLKETEQQLRNAGAAFDPRLSQIRLARETLEVADHRVAELKARLLNLQQPGVVVLGAE